VERRPVKRRGNLIPEHSAASFVMVVFPEYPYQLGPSAKQPVFEFHYRACLWSPMGERHAEPIRGYIDEVPSERRSPALLNKAYFAFTSNAQIHPAIPDRLFLARV
jgi:hypothetical protein